MRRAIFFIGFITLLSFQSCSYLIDNDKKANELAIQRIDTINWNEVDNFPLFESCNELAPRAEQKNCFEATLTGHLIDTLNGYEFVIKEAVLDTIILELKIDNKGAISILGIRSDEMTKKELPGLEKALKTSINSLPKIYAAQKKARSEYEIQLVPVATRFTLPIVLNVN